MNLKQTLAACILAAVLTWLVLTVLCLHDELEITVEALLETQKTILARGEFDKASRRQVDEQQVLIFRLENYCRGLNERLEKLECKKNAADK